jgi:AcrR family transcriptional regulator
MARRTAEESEATRAALIDAARELFGARGYEAVGTEEIVAAAGVTRGALYHHFRDKRDLFRACFIALEQEFSAQVGAKAYAEPDPFRRLQVALEATLELAAAGGPAVRVTLVEAPAVLGFDVWREIVSDLSLGDVSAVLGAAMEAGVLRTVPVQPLAQVLMGALNEATRLVAAGEPVAAVEPALLALLEGLRT